MLEGHEEEILIRMLEKEIIMMSYTSAEKVASKIKWGDIARKFRVKKSFNSVIRSLINKGLVTDHGKSGRVVSLTKDGIDFAYYLREKRMPKFRVAT